MGITITIKFQLCKKLLIPITICISVINFNYSYRNSTANDTRQLWECITTDGFFFMSYHIKD